MKIISPLLALGCGLIVGYFLFGRSEQAPVASTSGQSHFSGASSLPASNSVQDSGFSPEFEAFEPESGFSQEWLEAYERMTPVARYAALAEMMSTISVEDYPRILDQIRDQSEEGIGQLRNVVQQQWIATDPQGMLAYVETLDYKYQQSLRHQVFREWAKQDFDAAWATAQSLPIEKIREQMIASVIGGAAMESPHRVLSLLQAGQLPARQGQWMYRSVFQALAETDPAQARQMAAAMPPGDEKKFALLGSLDVWIQDDFNAALAWINSLPMDSGVFRARTELLQGIRSHDFEAVREIIDSQSDPELQKELLQQVQIQSSARGRSFDEIVEMLSWLEARMSPGDLKNKMSSTIYAMADSDLARTVDYAISLPYGQARLNALGAVANKMAQDDLESVIRFAASLEYDDERTRVLDSITHQVLRQGAETAAAFILEHNDSVLQQRVAPQLVREWAAYDRASTIEWMGHLTDEEAIRRSQSELLRVWGAEDAAGAARYIEETFEVSQRSRVYRDVIGNLAYQDPQGAVAWLEHLPEGGVKNEKDIYSRIAGAYVNVDPLAASEWVDSLEVGKLRDASIKALAQKVVRFEPESAFIWANSVDNAAVRKDTQSSTIREWAKRDPDAAYQAVKDARIDAEEKVPLFKEIEKQRKPVSQSEEPSDYGPVMISVVN